jgi:hypothetical protein
MTTANFLSQETALAIQKYRELQKILNGKGIETIAVLHESPQKSRAILLLFELQGFLKKLEDHFHQSNLESIPIVEFALPHKAFLADELIPNAKAITGTLWESFMLPLFVGETDDMTESSETDDITDSVRYKNALNHLLDFWLDTLSGWEKEEHSDFIDTCNELREIINGSWFDPDGWSERQRMLRPVLLPNGRTDRVRDHVRVRLTEVYRAFVFGQFMSSVALCRTLAEFALAQNARKLGFPMENDNPWDRTLSQLIAGIRGQHPALAAHTEAIRDVGNRVIRPQKRSVVALPRVLQAEALDCIEHTVAVLEVLYGESR